MKSLTIQARLTAWYFLSLAIIAGIFASGSWFAMKRSMYHSVDRDLRYRIRSVAPFIESRSLRTQEQFSKVFEDSSDSAIVGVFVQITDEQSGIVYESDVLRRHRVPALAPGKADGAVAIATGGEEGWPVRVASKRLVVAGTGLTVHVVEPLRDLEESLEDYSVYLLVLIPISLLLTTTAVSYTHLTLPTNREV